MLWEHCIYCIKLVGVLGFEPRTKRLRVSCSDQTELHARRYCRYCLPTALRQAVLHSQDLVVVFHGGRRTTLNSIPGTRNYHISSELRIAGRGTFTTCSYCKTRFLTSTKKPSQFPGRLPCVKILSAFTYIAESLNKEAVVRSLLSYPNVPASCAVGIIIACTGACQDFSLDVSEHIVNDKVNIEILVSLV
jgi:hypothetical protein